METDYDNYALVANCYGIDAGHVEYSFFMTRDREWPDNNKEKVQYYSKRWCHVKKYCDPLNSISRSCLYNPVCDANSTYIILFEPAKEQVQALLYKINNDWGLDIDKLIVTDQKECERYPIP